MTGMTMITKKMITRKMTIEPEEGYQGLGRARRREMIRRWKEEGKGLSLKEWARQQSGVGDAALVWLETKKTA